MISFYEKNKYNYKLLSNKKFLTSNLFLTNISIIPKIWTLLFSFKKDYNTLGYIIANLLPLEREIFFIIKENFYDKINDVSQISDYIEFTNNTNFFYNENNFLWNNLIEEKFKKDLREENIKV